MSSCSTWNQQRTEFVQTTVVQLAGATGLAASTPLKPCPGDCTTINECGQAVVACEMINGTGWRPLDNGGCIEIPGQDYTFTFECGRSSLQIDKELHAELKTWEQTNPIPTGCTANPLLTCQQWTDKKSNDIAAEQAFLVNQTFTILYDNPGACNCTNITSCTGAYQACNIAFPGSVPSTQNCDILSDNTVLLTCRLTPQAVQQRMNAFTQQWNSVNPAPPNCPPPPPPGPTGKSGLSTTAIWIIVGVSVGVVILAIGLGVGLGLKKKKSSPEGAGYTELKESAA